MCIARYTAALLLCAVSAFSQAASTQGNAPQPGSTSAQQGVGTGPASANGRISGARRPVGTQTGTGGNTAAGSTGSNGVTGGNGNGNGQAAGTGAGSGRNRGASSTPPAPVSTQSVYQEGQGTAGRSASDDRPLLPIAQLSDSLGIPSGTPIRVRLKQPVDSGHAKNGDTLDAVLAEPVGGQPSGTPVQLTVVLSLRAGMITSHGELSLQVIRIANHRVLSEIVTALGKDGPKELPDAAPSLGTEAGFSPDQVITLSAA